MRDRNDSGGGEQEFITESHVNQDTHQGKERGDHGGLLDLLAHLGSDLLAPDELELRRRETLRQRAPLS